jgi:transcriptional regulator with XRE-family HTH domain
MIDPETLSPDDKNKIFKAADKFLPLFLEEVKQHRLSLAWTQEDLAAVLRSCGIPATQSYLSRLEKGQRTDPSIPIIIALATLFSISLDEIVSLAQRGNESADEDQ